MIFESDGLNVKFRLDMADFLLQALNRAVSEKTGDGFRIHCVLHMDKDDVYTVHMRKSACRQQVITKRFSNKPKKKHLEPEDKHGNDCLVIGKKKKFVL